MNTLDKAARELVIARDGVGCPAGMARCQVCRVIFPTSELEASHHILRRNVVVRFDCDNLSAKCIPCHKHMDRNPLEHAEWIRHFLGDERYNALKERANREKLTGSEKWKQLKQLRAEKKRWLETR